MTGQTKCDVAVLGSGFGGSLLSLILSREGMSVVMVDKARHPRFVIGESSTPAADFLLHQLASRHQLHELLPLVRFGAWRDAYPNINCGCKRGFTYFWHAAPEGFQATADHCHELLVTANASRVVADTQWYRPQVDQFLAEVAQNHGVTLLQETEIADIDHRAPHEWAVKVTHDGHTETLRASFLVDASGPAGVLHRHLQTCDSTDRLLTHSSAVYSHWTNVRPVADWLQSCHARTKDYPYPCQDSVIHHLFDDGWLWRIGFEDGVTSLGYVFADDRPIGANDPWKELFARKPVLREILGEPTLTAMPGRIYVTGRLQRLASVAAGDDWAALPYTAGFIDALHSTGIAHTLSGVDRLSRILLGGSDQRSRMLAGYSQAVIEELLHIDRLVSGCYRGLKDFRVFTAWTMLYFAAATTFEKHWADAARSTGFLCAKDRQFVELVQRLCDELARLMASGSSPSDDAVVAFCNRIEDAVQPYNHVGLFHPPLPNMYHHTAAPK